MGQPRAWRDTALQPASIIEFALEHEDLTPRELAVKYTDEKQYFISESSAYRILKAEDLITAPGHIVMKGETLSAIDGVDGSRSRYRNVP